MIHSRLDPTERSEVRSGSVFIWEERSNSSVPGYGPAPTGTSHHLLPYAYVYAHAHAHAYAHALMSF